MSTALYRYSHQPPKTIFLPLQPLIESVPAELRKGEPDESNQRVAIPSEDLFGGISPGIRLHKLANLLPDLIKTPSLQQDKIIRVSGALVASAYQLVTLRERVDPEPVPAVKESAPAKPESKKPAEPMAAPQPPVEEKKQDKSASPASPAIGESSRSPAPIEPKSASAEKPSPPARPATAPEPPAKQFAQPAKIDEPETSPKEAAPEPASTPIAPAPRKSWLNALVHWLTAPPDKPPVSEPENRAEISEKDAPQKEPPSIEDKKDKTPKENILPARDSSATKNTPAAGAVPPAKAASPTEAAPPTKNASAIKDTPAEKPISATKEGSQPASTPKPEPASALPRPEPEKTEQKKADPGPSVVPAPGTEIHGGGMRISLPPKPVRVGSPEGDKPAAPAITRIEPPAKPIEPPVDKPSPQPVPVAPVSETPTPPPAAANPPAPPPREQKQDILAVIPIRESASSDKKPEAPLSSRALEEIPDQESVQALFLTEDELTIDDVVEHCTRLPGIRCCILARGSGVISSARVPDGIDILPLTSHAMEMVKAMQGSFEKMGVGDIPAITLHSARGLLTLFPQGEVCLLVLHADRSFIPGVREKLMATVEALADANLPLALGNSNPD